MSPGASASIVRSPFRSTTTQAKVVGLFAAQIGRPARRSKPCADAGSKWMASTVCAVAPSALGLEPPPAGAALGKRRSNW